MATNSPLLAKLPAYAQLADGSDASAETHAQLQEAKANLHAAKVRKASALAAHNTEMEQQGKLVIEVLQRVGTEALDDELVISTMAHFLSGSSNNHDAFRSDILTALNAAFHERYPGITAYYRGSRVVIDMEDNSEEVQYPSNMGSFVTLLNQHMPRHLNRNSISVSSVVVRFLFSGDSYDSYSIYPSADQDGFLVPSSAHQRDDEFNAPKLVPSFETAIDVVDEFDSERVAEERAKQAQKPWWKRR